MYLGKIVETAPAAEIFDNPLHPYTQALLSSVPTLTRRRFTKRIVLEGDVPTAIDPPAGLPLREPLLPRHRALPRGGAAARGHRRATPATASPASTTSRSARTTDEGRGRQATTADGVTLRGELVRGGDVWICLVHDVGEDIDAWRPLRAGPRREGLERARARPARSRRLRRRSGTTKRGALDVDLGVTLARRLGARHVCVVAAGPRRRGDASGRGAGAPRAAHSRCPTRSCSSRPARSTGSIPMTLRGSGPAEAVRARRQGSAGRRIPRRSGEPSIGWTVGVTFGTEARGTALVAEWRANVLDKIVGLLKEQTKLRGLGEAAPAAAGGALPGRDELIRDRAGWSSAPLARSMWRWPFVSE